MRVVYETKGRAREYSELALNLYDGCSHGCRYCYGPAVLHKSREAFRKPKPRKDVLLHLAKDAEKLAAAGEERPILLCFTCDPYQPIEGMHEITRQAIKILKTQGLRVAILTKAGVLAQRDMNLLDGRDEFAVSLTCKDAEITRCWEPRASLPQDRIVNLMTARHRGIKTWVSLEPVLDPIWALYWVTVAAPIVDHFKVGKLNYHQGAAKIDWARFAHRITDLLERHQKDYYIKQDLAQYLGREEGFWRHDIEAKKE